MSWQDEMRKVTHTLHVSTYPDGPVLPRLKDGRPINQTLAYYVAEFGKVFKVKDLAGAEHLVDLRPFDDLDPEKTRVRISFYPSRRIEVPFSAPPSASPPPLQSG